MIWLKWSTREQEQYCPSDHADVTAIVSDTHGPVCFVSKQVYGCRETWPWTWMRCSLGCRSPFYRMVPVAVFTESDNWVRLGAVDRLVMRMEQIWKMFSTSRFPTVSDDSAGSFHIPRKRKLIYNPFDWTDIPFACFLLSFCVAT